jgi:hypothetical protein
MKRSRLRDFARTNRGMKTFVLEFWEWGGMFRSLSASCLIERYPGRLRLRHSLVQLSQVKRIGPGVRISETNIGTAVYKIKSFLRALEIFFARPEVPFHDPRIQKKSPGSLKETSADRKDLLKDRKEIPISTLPRPFPPWKCAFLFYP